MKGTHEGNYSGMRVLFLLSCQGSLLDHFHLALAQEVFITL